MWEPRLLTTLWSFMACYRDSFNFTLLNVTPSYEYSLSNNTRNVSQWTDAGPSRSGQGSTRRHVARLVLRHNWRHWQRIVFKRAMYPAWRGAAYNWAIEARWKRSKNDYVRRSGGICMEEAVAWIKTLSQKRLGETRENNEKNVRITSPW
jgi:hypothetical protein